MFIEPPDNGRLASSCASKTVKSQSSLLSFLVHKLNHKCFLQTLPAPKANVSTGSSTDTRIGTVYTQQFVGHREESGADTTALVAQTYSAPELVKTFSIKDLNALEITQIFTEQVSLLKETLSGLDLTAFLESAILQKTYPPDITILGKLIYLYEIETTSIKKLIEERKFLELQEHIESKFKENFTKICKRVDDEKERQKKFNSVYGELYYYSAISSEIAEMVITQSGALNVGLLPFIQTACIERHPDVSYTKSLEHTIGLLIQESSLRIKIAQVQKPAKEKKPSNLIIQSARGNSQSHCVTDREARVAALASLLSHLRQGAKRSCFASYLAINLKSSFLERCIDDITSLLRCSRLTREINGITRSFIYLQRVADPYISQEFLVKANGTLYRDGVRCGKIWTHVSLVRALKILNFEDPKEILKGYCKSLIKQGEQLTLSQVIRNLAIKSVKENLVQVSKERAVENALFAFSSGWSNLLMRSWVNAIAGMAESQANCYFSSSLIKAVLSTVHSLAKGKDNLGHFEEQLCRILVKRIRFLYDPSVISQDFEEEGAFVLFESEGSGLNQKLRPLETKEDFEKFIQRSLSEAAEELQFGELPSISVEEIHKHFVKNIGFSLQRAEKCNIKPWISPLGHDSLEIMKVYLERDDITESHVINPKNAHDLLMQLIQLFRALPGHEKYLLNQKPDSLRPVRIVNQHAFCLMPCDKSFKGAWQSKQTTRSWIESTIIKPNKGIILADMSDHAATIKEEFGIKIPDSCSYKDTRALLCENRTEKDVDLFLFSLFPQIATSAIHFADTNLQSSLKDIHFCFIYNPGSQKVELWQILDGTNTLIPVDASTLLEKKQWELFLYADDLF